MRAKRPLVALAVLSLLAAACGDSSSGSSSPTESVAATTTAAAVTTAPASTAPGDASSDQMISQVIEAPGGVSITVDGDASDWADIPGTDVALKPITGEPSAPRDAVVKVAHDDAHAYVLFQVTDDLNWNPDNVHLSAAAAVQWAIDPGAGDAMGATDDVRDVSLGLVDIWHWELECGSGVLAGGGVDGHGDATGGNDQACNFDDEYASQTDVREDDDTASGDNSLAGVWSHSAATEDGEGTWTFEMSRPLDTGDQQDAVFTPGESSLMAVAYWDPDRADGSDEGWDDDYHVVSSMDGWLQVNWGTETGGGSDQAAPVEEAEIGATVDAPGGVSITVDGDAADWSEITGLDLTLTPITGEPAEPRDATLKFAHDDTNVYVLFQVQDDLNWDPANTKKSGAAGIQWQIDPEAPEHMGAEDDEREISLGMVDLWHWELECASGVVSGGSASDAGSGDPGNDAACNFDDEYANSVTDREDDNTASGENSLTGVWTHTASAENEAGTWTFEMSRPMNTGDATDTQFAAGGSSLMAAAYWDPDRPDGGTEGWDDDYHVVSAYDGWIQVDWK